jgi:hypothetical protein
VSKHDLKSFHRVARKEIKIGLKSCYSKIRVKLFSVFESYPIEDITLKSSLTSAYILKILCEGNLKIKNIKIYLDTFVASFKIWINKSSNDKAVNFSETSDHLNAIRFKYGSAMDFQSSIKKGC